VDAVRITNLDVGILRSLFRNLADFRALYESSGIDLIRGPGGIEYSLWDLEHLYEHFHLLPPRQAEAIELCFIQQHRERDAAVMMGVSVTNPVCVYAKEGLINLLKLIDAGVVRGFRSLEEVA
jgi:hypothetical protein